jgi:aprataxin
MSGNLNILRAYAQKNPAEFPASILFSHTSRSLTIYDAFPKSIFHFLILPRIQSTVPLTLSDLHSLKSVLQADKTHARAVITSLSEDAAQLRTEIEAEMIKMYGFKWPVNYALFSAQVRRIIYQTRRSGQDSMVPHP